MSNSSDLTGQIFNRLTVIEKDTSRKGGYWICQCECGNKKSIAGRHLRSGVTKSCGCLQREKAQKQNLIDLTGQQFGRLTVLEKDLSKKETCWICRCECGQIKSINGANLRKGATKSCGCFAKESSSQRQLKDLSGQIFGELKVIKKVENTERTSWLCKCSCGNETVVLSSNLLNGRTRSCGCFKKSHGEKQIRNILDELNLEYKREYSFNDLFGDVDLLRFDFAIFKNNILLCLIEYQGQQHFKPSELFGGEEEFFKRQRYDNKKRQYCLKHNIKLIEIPYWDLKKISPQYLFEKGLVISRGAV